MAGVAEALNELGITEWVLRGEPTSEDEMKTKITEGLEKQFEQQSDQKLLNDVTEYLVAKTKFDLPAEFLKKWMQSWIIGC